MGSDSQKRNRSKQYTERLPTHFCRTCSTVTYDDDDVCLECGGNRPENGWTSLQNGHDTWLGRVLDGRYLVTRRVGQGAAGAVYRAESLAISRQFAIKIINFKQGPAGLDPEQIRARLNREIEALGRLRNPHVVPFYEVLEVYGNFVAVVMDFVEGDTLESVVEKGGPMAIDRAMSLLRQIANGVHEAHEAGMIHRDLKPENLMVERMPAGDDFVHILDFGIVRMEDGVSMTKGFLGTPLYASPEQAMAGEIDRRSDIYSLGAIFFFMLTGRPPFFSENVYEILRAHVRSKPPTLSDVAETEFPEELESLVASMLSKSPQSRPQTLSEVIKQSDRLVRSGALKRIRRTKDSVELQPIGAADRGTGGFERVGSDLNENTFSREDTDGRLQMQSNDADTRGNPRAGIFRRESKSEVRRALAAAESESEVDAVVGSDSSVFRVGFKMSDVLDASATGGGTRLVFLDSGGQIVLGAAGGDPATVIQAGIEDATCIASAGENLLIGTDQGEVIQIIDRETRVLYQDVRRAEITALSVDKRGDHVVVGSASGRVYLGTLTGRGRNWSRVQNGSPVAEVAISANSQNFAIARQHGEVEMFTTGSPRTAMERFSVSAPVKHLAFSHDGHILAVLREDHLIELRLTMTGSKMASLQAAGHDVVSLSFSRDGGLLGYFLEGGEVHGIDLQRELVRSS